MVEGLLQEHVDVYGRQPLAMRPEVSCLTSHESINMDEAGKRLKDLVWQARIRRNLRTEGLPAEDTLNLAVETRRPARYDKGSWVGSVPLEFTNFLTEQRYGRKATSRDVGAAFWSNCNNFAEAVETAALGGHLYETGVVVKQGPEVAVLSLGMPCAPDKAWWRYMTHPEVMIKTEALRDLEKQGLDLPKIGKPELTDERYWWERLGERVREERLVGGLARETNRLTRPSFSQRVREGLKEKVDRDLHNTIGRADEIYGYLVTTEPAWGKQMITRKLTQQGGNLAEIKIHPVVKPDLAKYSRDQRLWCNTLNGIVNSDGGPTAPDKLLVRISTVENANGDMDHPGVLGVAVMKLIESKAGSEYWVSRVLGEQSEREGKYDDPGVTILPVESAEHQYMMQRSMGRKDLELIKADLEKACARAVCDDETQNKKTWSKTADGLTARTTHIVTTAKNMVEVALASLPEEQGVPVRNELPRVIERVDNHGNYGLAALDKAKRNVQKREEARKVFEGEIKPETVS